MTSLPPSLLIYSPAVIPNLRIFRLPRSETPPKYPEPSWLSRAYCKHCSLTIQAPTHLSTAFITSSKGWCCSGKKTDVGVPSATHRAFSNHGCLSLANTGALQDIVYMFKNRVGDFPSLGSFVSLQV